MLGLEQPETPDSAAVDTAPPETNTGTPSDLASNPMDEDLPLEEEQVTPDDEEEEELDGVKIKGSKEAREKLKAERLMQSDYTRKTQEVADHRKNLEAERAQFQQTAQNHQQHIREVAKLVNIDDRLAEFEKAGITPAYIRQLADTDGVQALKLHNELIDLQSQRGQIVNSITQKQQAQAQQTQHVNAKQMLEARQVLERDIKGWSPDMANKLAEYGKSQGYTSEVLDNVTKPEFVKTLHKAYLYDQLQKQRTAKPPAEPSKPVTRVGGSAAVTTKEPAQMTDREFAQWRQKQIAQRR